MMWNVLDDVKCLGKMTEGRLFNQLNEIINIDTHTHTCTRARTRTHTHTIDN